MNTQTGDISTVFDEKTMRANFGMPLTLQDRQELGALPNTQERLRRYKQAHADDRCRKCALSLRQHSLREWQRCEAIFAAGVESTDEHSRPS